MPHEQGGAASSWVMPWNAEAVSNDAVRRSVELASMAYRQTHGLDSHPIRGDLRSGRSCGLRYRRAVTVLSVAGMFSMAIVSLYQMGILRHLPNPPIRPFHSDKVKASFPAHLDGMPDGALALVGQAVTVALAAFGGQDRARRMPWIPLAAAGKAAVEAAAAARSLSSSMPVVERAWRGYRMVDALTRFGILVFSLPEAMEVVRARLVRHRHRRQP